MVIDHGVSYVSGIFFMVLVVVCDGDYGVSCCGGGHGCGGGDSDAIATL